MRKTLFLIVALPLLGGCAAAGDLARTVGTGLSDYSAQNEGKGFLAGAAGVAGKVYTKAGDMVSPSPVRPESLSSKEKGKK